MPIVKFNPSLISVLICGTCLSPQAAHAWGAEGHQGIAKLAESQLTPKALGEVRRLLALEPGATMASVSTWADDHRIPVTAAWHYVNFPRNDCHHDADRNCPDGKCVVGAIERQSEIFEHDASDEKRLTALKYMIHFIGDVHQPLHAGYGENRGGNSYQVQAFNGGSNLHAVWDTGLIKNVGLDTDEFVAVLGASRSTTGWLMAAQIAEESCRVVAAPGFYPDRIVDASYVLTYTPVVKRQLVKAGDAWLSC